MERDRTAKLKQVDLTHVWHPFTQEKVRLEDGNPLIVDRAEGVFLYDIEGRPYLDGVSSLWCNVHGHSRPEIIGALKEQAERLCHSTLLGLSHTPVLELVEALQPLLPAGLTRLFFSDSGSAGVEAALRMALEFWQKETGETGRKKTKLVSLESSYHGDTLGSVGVGYDETFHRHVRSAIVPSFKVPPPHLFRFVERAAETEAVERSLEALSTLLRKSGDEIAALIVEPLVQGAAGIWTHPASFLKGAFDLAKKHNVLFIVDEVATGFGKTGKLFAVEHAEIAPDLLVMGKGLTGGYLPMSAVGASEQIFQAFLGAPEEFKTFFYGQTFAGNPLAARAAVESLKLFGSDRLLEQTAHRAAHLHRELEQKIAPLAHVDEVRSRGVMTGIELTKEPGRRVPYATADRAGLRITAEARGLGAVIRPLGNVMVLMPALAMDEAALTTLVDITATAIERALG